ncbi:unnamed protein product [Cyprideis torosa]|uniref:Uncharacterized protein n=1 Tax=Cyprideis torosa TaxID=163714 RepID=A0A7R8WG39_9CRUS|nr:unnamed protein product [Cyprideis torosa]CAG0897760.1 unnamed protein product [Cyprideis torosa]
MRLTSAPSLPEKLFTQELEAFQANQPQEGQADSCPVCLRCTRCCQALHQDNFFIPRVLLVNYYPEGGFGYVVLVCAAMSHLICGGLQLSAPVLGLRDGWQHADTYYGE